MKKWITLLMALVMVFTLSVGAFAEDIGGDVPPPPPVDPMPITPEPVTPEPVTPEPGPDPTPTPDPGPSEPESQPTIPTFTPADPVPTNPPYYPPSPQPQPSVPVAYGMPNITKNPTGETVKEGGFAEFVARADNCVKIIWHLKNPGGSIDILAQTAPNRFPGLVVTGLESERLGLDHISRDLNEWRVLAEFVGRDGSVWSTAAVINVINQELQAPTIQNQPKSVNLKPSEATTLQVGAMSSEMNTTLTYQWYKNTTNSNVGGKAILGATSSSYTPDYAPGTTYYYCAVRCTNGSEISVAAKSDCAAVSYLASSRPVIRNQAVTGSLAPDETTTLQVDASAMAAEGTVTYQWFRSATNSNEGGQAIPGATTANFIPPYEAGTTYYYCEVRSNAPGSASVVNKTDCTPVSYQSGGADSAASATLATWGAETSTTGAAVTLPQPVTQAPTRSNTLLIIVVAVIIVIALMGIIATIIILRFYSNREVEEEEPPRPAKQPVSRARQEQTFDFDEEDDNWDDLSDLGDLSIYFDDEQ